MRNNNFGMIEGKLIPFEYNELGDITQVCLQLSSMEKVKLIDNSINSSLCHFNGYKVKLLGWTSKNGFIVQDFSLTLTQSKKNKMPA